tara:strand:+ start:114 stop:590 length:477 start_codon:yes stop_codon:yes gene_type:complete
MFSSKSDNHTTPRDLFDQLNREFSFDWDAAATKENALVSHGAYFGPDHYAPHCRDGLEVQWFCQGWTWCNPPYGRALPAWTRKAAHEKVAHGASSVLLVPARTETRWWRNYVANGADEIRFMHGRLKFSGAKNSAPFPSAIVIYRPKIVGPYTWWRAK